MNEIESSDFEGEVGAIGSLLARLSPLSGPARERVLEYVVRALDINLPSVPVQRSTPSLVVERLPEGGQAVQHRSDERPVDIRSLKEAKQPSSANEMAAVVAYYLAEHAPLEERSDVVETADLEKYFKQAQFPLPGKIGNTLANAAQAGYFDSAERGKYRLNPVGHNLVVHGLPSGSTRKPPVRKAAAKKGAKKATAKKATAKKATAKKATAKKATAKRAS